MTLNGDASDGLESRDYDFASRHIITSRLVKAMLPAGSRLLDLGGSAGMTAALLPEYHVTVADVIPEGVDVVASGEDLPFASNVFDAVLALDVLEHIEEQMRKDVVAEATRVAGTLILAGPFDDPEVRRSEFEQREYFEAMYGRPHPWLAEHLACGLPSLEATVAALEGHGLSTQVFGSNPLAQWTVMLQAKHTAQRLELDERMRPLRQRLIEDYLDSADATQPCYRHFITAARDPEALSGVTDVIPGSDDEQVSSSVEEIRVATGAILDEAGRDLTELRAHVDNLEGGLNALHGELRHRLEIIDESAAELERRLEVIDELAAELSHRQQVIDELAAELSHRQQVIDELAAELSHRQEVIDELAAEAQHRLEIIDEVVSERDALAHQAHALHNELAELRQIVDDSLLARTIVRRRSRP